MELTPEMQRALDATTARMQAGMAEAERAMQTAQLDGNEVYICYMDLDGFKEQLEADPAGLFEKYSRRLRYMTAQFFRATGQASGTEVSVSAPSKLLWPYVFSDSIFIVTRDDSDEALAELCHAAAGMWMRCTEIDMTARGGIAHGQVWWHPEQQIVLGPALTQAYVLAESLRVFGVAVHDDVRSLSESTTDPVEVHVKVRDGKETTEEVRALRFARVRPVIKHDLGTSQINTASYRESFRKLVAAYSERADKESHIVDRYQRSVPVMEAMLPVHDLATRTAT